MGLKLNPITGQFDLTGSGGGASYIDGEVATYNDLSLDAGVAPLNTAWLVRGSSGIWPFTKPGGVYVRTATGGSSRDADYTYAGIFPDVFSDANFTLYDEGDTSKNLKFQLSGITTGTTRTLTVPNNSGTITLNSDLAAIATSGSASDLGSGTVPTARLGTGTASSGTWLRGDSTWQALPASGTKTYAVFTAEHNQPPSTAFATLDTRNSIAVLDFDAATDENAVFVGIMPEAASLGSGLIVRLHWMATTATSGNVRWGVQFERSNTDLDSDSFDTAVEATAATNGTSGIITTTAITVTTIDGITAGDVFRLKVFRNADDATNDTMTGDAELVAVEVRSAA